MANMRGHHKIMILLDQEEASTIRAAKIIIWLHGSQWSSGTLQDCGIDEEQLLDEERVELIEQLTKQESRVKGLFGL